MASRLRLEWEVRVKVVMLLILLGIQERSCAMSLLRRVRLREREHTHRLARSPRGIGDANVTTTEIPMSGRGDLTSCMKMTRYAYSAVYVY